MSWQPAGARASCPSGWSSNNGNCYYVSTDELEQPDARAFCQTAGGDLASISDDAEDSYLDSILYVVSMLLGPFCGAVASPLSRVVVVVVVDITSLGEYRSMPPKASVSENRLKTTSI